MENTIAYFGLKDEDDYMYKRGEKKAEARFLKESAAQKADAERQKADAERQKADAERQKAEAERRIKESQIREKEIRKHLEQTQRFTVVQLLDAATLTEYQIIKVFGVTDAFVQSVKKDLAAAPKKIEQLKTKMTAEEIAQTLNLPINWIEKQLE